MPAPVLLAVPILLTTGFQLTVFLVGLVVASDAEIHASDGVLASLSSIAVVAAVALVLAFGIALATRSTPSRTKVAAIVLGALAVLSLPAFWAGAPAIFGVNAAWVGGLARGGRPQSGAARGFAVVGLVAAILNVVADLVMTGGHLVMHGYQD